jgi:hypothetical protein
VRILFYNKLEWWISLLQVTVFEQIYILSICFCDEAVYLFTIPATELDVLIFIAWNILIISIIDKLLGEEVKTPHYGGSQSSIHSVA